MSVLSRWQGRLAARRGLLDHAERSVRYWTRRAKTAHGRAMLAEARARLALRHRQVDEAARIVARHTKVDSVSNAGVALIAGFEGFSAKPYRDAVGVWTIGYGETAGVHAGTRPWTRAHALARLRLRANRDYLKPVLELADEVRLTLTQNEADALTSLVYNLGPGILAAGRTMGDAIRSKDRRRIADAFLVYDKAGGRTLLGLTRRRQAERALFLR